MSELKMREEFAAAYLAEMVRMFGKSISAAAMRNIEHKKPNGDFADPMLGLSFWAWRASRKALVIELPKIINKDWACDASECEFMRGGINLTKLSILAAGVKVKS